MHRSTMPSDDVFLGRVTHDLRGELATMVSGVHYLLRYEGGLGGSGRQMLERVNGAGQRMRRLLDELELCAWIEGAPPKAPFEGEAYDLGPLVHAAVSRLGSAIAQRGTRVEIEISEELCVRAIDPDLAGAAIELVIDFAIARSPAGVVRVSGAASADDARAPSIRVADAGGAVAPDALARIFDPFVERGLVAKPEPGARRRERLGLGLAIARGVLVAHGGAAIVEAEPEGVAITLRFAPFAASSS